MSASQWASGRTGGKTSIPIHLKHRAGAVSKKKPKAEIVMVSNSCGCVFCDLDPDVIVDGVKFHNTQRGNILCERKTK